VKTIRITTGAGLRSVEVRAHVFGGWAAHPAHGSRTGWSISDVRSGLACAHELDAGDAIAVARHLGSRIKAPRVIGSFDEIASGEARYSPRIDKHEFLYLIEALIGEALHR
jgi:hypothetical protein